MRITVFGATGSNGHLVVEQALDAGHDVTAFTRGASRVTTRHERLRVLTGDVTDPDDCLPAVRGADAVVITLGAARKGVVREAGTRAVVAAMERDGGGRLICQSTVGIGSSRGNLDLASRLLFATVLRAAYADHERQEQVVRSSSLDWTIVRPSHFAARSPGPVRHGFDATEPGLSLKIGRDDVARLVLDQVGDRATVGRAISISA